MLDLWRAWPTKWADLDARSLSGAWDGRILPMVDSTKMGLPAMEGAFIESSFRVERKEDGSVRLFQSFRVVARVTFAPRERPGGDGRAEDGGGDE